MERDVLALTPAATGGWTAELSCLHVQRIEATAPRPSIGSTLDCPRCDRAELPEGLQIVRATATWAEGSMPAALRRAHRVASGRWGRLRVEEGQVRFRAATTPPFDVLIGPGGAQPIPPGVDHDVEPQGPVRFFVEFLEKPPLAPDDAR